MADEISTLMNNNKSKEISLRLRNNKTVSGTLKDFDIHMNLTLENAQEITDGESVKLGTILLRGDNILSISLPTDES